MKLTIESTPEITYVNGVPARIWNGKTEKGIECKVIVHGVVVKSGEDQSAFEAELIETHPPADLRVGPGYDQPIPRAYNRFDL